MGVDTFANGATVDDFNDGKKVNVYMHVQVWRVPLLESI